MKSEKRIFQKARDFKHINYNRLYWLNIWTRIYLEHPSGKQKIREHSLFIESMQDIDEEEKWWMSISGAIISVIFLILEYFTKMKIALILLCFATGIVLFFWRGNAFYDFISRLVNIPYQKVKWGYFWFQRKNITMDEMLIVKEQLRIYSNETLENILLYSYKRSRTIFIWFKSLGRFFIKPFVVTISLIVGKTFFYEIIKDYLLVLIDNLFSTDESLRNFILIAIIILGILSYTVCVVLLFEKYSRIGKAMEVAELLPRLIKRELENRKTHKTNRKRRYRKVEY